MADRTGEYISLYWDPPGAPDYLVVRGHVESDVFEETLRREEALVRHEGRGKRVEEPRETYGGLCHRWARWASMRSHGFDLTGTFGDHPRQLYFTDEKPEGKKACGLFPVTVIEKKAPHG